MISRAERQHLTELKQWCVDARAALEQIQRSPVGVLLNKLPGGSATTVFDNMDWLIALIEREANARKPQRG